jgi:hypothetical protein
MDENNVGCQNTSSLTVMFKQSIVTTDESYSTSFAELITKKINTYREGKHLDKVVMNSEINTVVYGICTDLKDGRLTGPLT